MTDTDLRALERREAQGEDVASALHLARARAGLPDARLAVAAALQAALTAREAPTCELEFGCKRHVLLELRLHTTQGGVSSRGAGRVVSTRGVDVVAAYTPLSYDIVTDYHVILACHRCYGLLRSYAHPMRATPEGRFGPPPRHPTFGYITSMEARWRRHAFHSNIAIEPIEPTPLQPLPQEIVDRLARGLADVTRVPPVMLGDGT